MTDEIEWVLLRRYDDSIEAEIALSFLREHGIEATLHGNGATTGVLNRLTTVMELRLLVPRTQLEEAQEALAALSAPDESAPPPDFSSEDSAASPTASPYRAGPSELSPIPFQTRYRRAAALLAIALPIGSGHFYAQHHAAGIVFGCGILGLYALGATLHAPWLCLASVLLVGADALFGAFAVDRYNAGKVPPPLRQTAFAAAAVGLSVLTAYVLAASPTHTRNDRPTFRVTPVGL